MKIDVGVLKELRSATGAGIGDCKEALEASAGDIDKAREYLREKGVAKAHKKSSRDVADGLVAVHVEGTKGAILKLGCETDFVARNDRFRAFALDLAKRLHDFGSEDLDAFLAMPHNKEGGSSIKDEIVGVAAVLGENVVVSSIGVINLASEGVLASYVHSAVGAGIGRAAALVTLEVEGKLDGGSRGELEGFAKQIAMHIVAAKPESVSIDSLSSSVVEYERSMVSKEVKELGKPDSVAEKIIEGRMQKFFEDMVLMEQTFVIDGKTKVCNLLQERSDKIGCKVRVAGYKLFSIS